VISGKGTCRPTAKILASTTSDNKAALSSDNPALLGDKRGLLEPLFLLQKNNEKT
jgi:hypothetical protein